MELNESSLNKLLFTSRAWTQYLYWQETDKRRVKKINELIKATMRTPVEGVGKPEALVGEFSGFWSRRIDEEHRLVYGVRDDTLEIIQCRYHYWKS